MHASQRLRSALNAACLSCLHLHQYCASKYMNVKVCVARSCMHSLPVKMLPRISSCLRHSVVSEKILAYLWSLDNIAKAVELPMCLCTDSYRLQFAFRRRSTNATTDPQKVFHQELLWPHFRNLQCKLIHDYRSALRLHVPSVEFFKAIIAMQSSWYRQATRHREKVLEGGK